MCTAGLLARAVRGYRAKANIHAWYQRHPNRLIDIGISRSVSEMGRRRIGISRSLRQSRLPVRCSGSRRRCPLTARIGSSQSVARRMLHFLVRRAHSGAEMDTRIGIIRSVGLEEKPCRPIMGRPAVMAGGRIGKSRSMAAFLVHPGSIWCNGASGQTHRIGEFRSIRRFLMPSVSVLVTTLRVVPICPM